MTVSTLFCILCMGLLLSCGQHDEATVVVYTALDEMYSRPILDDFERQTGIKVLAVYDTEASKTTGLVTRLMAERNRPRADVFWNNEVAQTIVLKNQGVLEAYKSPSAEGIPKTFKDAESFWCGFAARGRVIIYNTDQVETPPTSILDLLKPEWKGRCAVAKPLFGTTATHAAALFAQWGDEKATAFFRGLLENDVAILAGNATVRDLVARGEYAWGLTDTDDANGGMEDGFPVKWLFPDQEVGGLGTLVIPNTVALIKDAPHSENGKKLIDYLLSATVEQRLAGLRSIQIPLRPDVTAPAKVPRLANIRTMEVAFAEVADKMESTALFIRTTFLK
jgi:iron(III) transport system substrate-binding protein